MIRNNNPTPVGTDLYTVFRSAVFVLARLRARCAAAVRFVRLVIAITTYVGGLWQKCMLRVTAGLLHSEARLVLSLHAVAANFRAGYFCSRAPPFLTFGFCAYASRRNLKTESTSFTYRYVYYACPSQVWNALGGALILLLNRCPIPAGRHVVVQSRDASRTAHCSGPELGTRQWKQSFS